VPVREEKMAETRKVSINNMAYNPANLTIKVGDTVEWTNQMAFDHTVTPTKANFLAAAT
jgi:plastocyanin